MLTDLHLKSVQQAIAQRRVVRLQYFSPGSGEFTERNIEPLGTIPQGKVWHVVAYCQLRQEFRTFRLDRMSKLSLNNTYEPHNAPALEAHLEQQSQATDFTLTKVLFAPSVVASVEAERYSYGFVTENNGAEATEMSFLVAEDKAFCRWLLSYGDAVKIVLPSDWQRALEESAK